ncbi:alpha/beta hydrolase [Paracoccus tegillarcae]|uniref:Alpha/beta hydrolase n=1 Tax=Paracoccus tegillarcae TaxID=1529068 RepID=A0A2K9EIX5_9RHOB|nr:alpha/beta hydrolase [Paracoccus tegillarcae]AUH34329.1 alpha/beta hydrolase [Paracoccus tegillarcae]
MVQLTPHILHRFGPGAFVVGLVTLLLSGCGGSDVLNALASERGVAVQRDISYGPEDRQAYDLYRPTNVQPKGLVIFYYGGSWDSGSRGMYEFLGTSLAKRGYVTAIPDYRLYPEVTFPAFVEDGALAFRAIRARVGDTVPTFVMGHSAGAHIAGMIALAPRYLNAQDLSPCGSIAGFIGLAGPYDFEISERYGPTFPAQTRNFSQVLPFAKEGRHPPTLLLHGTADTTVEPRDSQLLAQALRANGNMVELKLMEGTGHIGIVAAFSGALRFTAPTLPLVTDFMDRIAADPPGCR